MRVICLICLSSFSFGYITIQTSSIIHDAKGHQGLFYYTFDHMNHVQKTILSSSSLIGATIGCFMIFAYSSYTGITYTFSRKDILILSNIPIIVGGLVAIIAEWTSVWLTIIGFTLQGIGFGVSSIIAPILIAEISPTPVRAFLTSFSQLFITFGMLTSSLVAWSIINVKYGWIYVVFIGLIPSIIQYIFKKHIKKSPRLLIGYFYREQSKYNNLNYGMINCEEALNIIESFYSNEQDAQTEYKSITKHLIHNEDTCLNNRGGLFAMISGHNDEDMSDANFTRSLLIGIFMNAFQQLSGCNVIFYNSQRIVNYNMYTHPNLTFVGVSVVYGLNVIATLIWVCCLKYNFIKHRTLLFVGNAMMLTSVLLLAIVNINIDSATTHCENRNDLIKRLALSKIPFYVFGFAMSMGGFPWLFNTELFPLNNRIKFGSFCVFIQWFFNALISLAVSNEIFDSSTTTLYFICGGAILMCIGVIAKFIPETKGISLEFAVRAHNPGIIWFS
eukprot:328946_1